MALDGNQNERGEVGRMEEMELTEGQSLAMSEVMVKAAREAMAVVTQAAAAGQATGEMKEFIEIASQSEEGQVFGGMLVLVGTVLQAVGQAGPEYRELMASMVLHQVRLWKDEEEMHDDASQQKRSE